MPEVRVNNPEIHFTDIDLYDIFKMLKWIPILGQLEWVAKECEKKKQEHTQYVRAKFFAENIYLAAFICIVHAYCESHSEMVSPSGMLEII